MTRPTPWFLLGLVGCGFMEPFNAGLYGTADGTTAPALGCPDGDADGICDADDLCPGSDDGDDADGDDVPAGCDPCPLDLADDSDGDDVCDSDDLCPGEDDLADGDGDVLPDACDACPEDPANDGDGDAICDGADPCVGDGTNTCPWTVALWLQVDSYPSEASWALRYVDGVEIASGAFSQANQIVQEQYQAPYGSTVCLSVKDTFGDGGIAGEVTIVETNTVVGTWAKNAYTKNLSSCFDLVQ